ncbi:MAG: ribonuclease H-like domain-containing protein [Anaerolineae bacterium]
MEQNLHDRLRRLGLVQGAGQMRQPPRRQRKPIEELIAGEVVDTDSGPFFRYREIYPLEHLHGQERLSTLLPHTPHGPAILARDDRLAGVDLERIAFVDTETTGLAGGTGTYAFLVGVGVFCAEGFALHQFFMRDFGEEPAQLQALGELLDDMEAVVSFNGKSFDLPLLETRFIMARQHPRLVDAPHLDLLPAARRLWKYRLASCALSSLEDAVLGVQRTQADVPGWLIPGLYADYARSGDAREMPRIFYHNAQDILSLVTLAARMCDLLDAGRPLGSDLPGEDLYGLGRLLNEMGELDRAEAAYARAARSSRALEVREWAMRDLAYLLKRRERRLEALTWWKELARSAKAVYAYEELAKHYEWQDGDLHQALGWTREALALVTQWPPGSKRRATLVELEHRMFRLERKLAGLSGADPEGDEP